MRKLAWASLSFSAAVLVTHYLLPEVLRLPVMMALLVLGAVGAVGTKGKLRVGILLVCVFAALGILRYDVQVRTKLQQATLLAGRTEIITGIVAEYPEDRGGYSAVVVQLTADDRISGKALVYVYEALPNIRPGDIVRGEVSFVPAIISGDEETDTYIADGIYIRGYATSALYFMGQWWGRWLFAPLYFGNWIRETISESVPENGAAFLHALLTGDKAELYSQTENYHILQRAGIAHIVAVSGMHVSFLNGTDICGKPQRLAVFYNFCGTVCLYDRTVALGASCGVHAAAVSDGACGTQGSRWHYILILCAVSSAVP